MYQHFSLISHWQVAFSECNAKTCGLWIMGEKIYIHSMHDGCNSLNVACLIKKDSIHGVILVIIIQRMFLNGTISFEFRFDDFFK